MTPTTGIVLVSHQEVDHVKYVRSADCHCTDADVTDAYTGSLAPGQPFSAHLDLCYPDQYTVIAGWVDEETDEGFAFDLHARGDLDVRLTVIRRGFPDRDVPVRRLVSKPLAHWQGCAYPSMWTTYTLDPDGTNRAHLGGARLQVDLANRSSRVVRDIALNLRLALAGNPILQAAYGCS